MRTIQNTFDDIINDYTKIYYYYKKERKFKNMSDDELLNSSELSLNPRLLINSKRSIYNFYPFFYNSGDNSRPLSYNNIAILLTAKTDNQNAELSKLAEQNPAYIFQVSGRGCEIVTSIYESFYETFDYIFLRLTYELFQQINKNSLFMIVFHQLHKNYNTISDKIDKTDFLKRDSVREEAFYDILEKCINIYVIENLKQM